MWNSPDEQPGNDMSKEVNDMSAALNLSADCLQQFMAGNMSVERLAAMKPLTNEDENIPGSSRSWSQMQNSSLYPNTSYGSPSFDDILSGSSQATLAHTSPLNLPSSAQSDLLPFRSPPFVSGSSNLMELSTVTPSRIKNSPSAIVSKGVGHKRVPPEDGPSTSSKVMFSHLNTSDTEDTPDHVFDSTSDSSNQFKIVIGNNNVASNESTTNYFVDLNMVSKDDESLPEHDEENIPMTTDLVEPDEVDDTGNGNSESEMGENENEPSSRKGRRGNVLTKIPKAIRGLMGEANLAYARGAHDDAIKMCMEVVRQAPYAAEPYDTLSMIYDERGESVRSLQYCLLAAHLSKTTADHWLHLAALCIGQGDIEKAIDCYSRAAKVRPTDHSIHAECGKLCMKQSHISKAIFHYKAAVMLMPPEDGAAALELVRSLTKMCHSEAHNELGIGLLEQAFESHPSHCKDEDANLLCELYLLEKQCFLVFKLLSKHFGLLLETGSNDEEPDCDDVIKVEAPPDMAVDLMCKVAIAAIQIDKSKLVEDIVKSICAHSPSDTGDIQFELSEAYSAAGKHSDALTILDSLVASRDYSLAGVWLRHGECHRLLGNIESALNSYKNCVRLAPGHAHAHLLYSKVLRKAEKYSQASQTLDVAENYEIDPDDHVQLYYERYKVFKIWGERSKKRKGNISTAADAALVVFVNKFKNSAFKESRIYLIRRTKPSSNPMAGELKLVQLRHLQMPDQADLTQSDLYLKSNYDVRVTKEKWMRFFDETISILIRCRRYNDAIALASGLQYHCRWGDHAPTRKHFEHVTFTTCIIAEQYQKAYSVLSPWIRSNMNNNALWNTFNQLITKTEDQRHQKFCLRLLIKHPRNLPLIVVAAHNWMASGFYKTALSEYTYAHKQILCNYMIHHQVPTEPLYLFMICVAFVNLCSQKFTGFKHSFVAQALAYFHKYLESRGLKQECYYNIGRAMHQLGLEHFAIHYYEKALDCPPPDIPDIDCETMFGLKHEIAFNLSLIYRKSGNDLVANDILVKYCTV